MQNIIVIVGLPGSGKTTLANKIKEVNKDYIIIDDPKNFSIDIEPHIVNGQNIILVDPNLCFDKNRDRLVELIKKLNPNIKIDWIFFENNPTKCLNNIHLRSDNKNVKSFIKQFSKFYRMPENSNVFEIWQEN